MSGRPAEPQAPGDHLDDDALVEVALAPGDLAARTAETGAAPRRGAGDLDRAAAHLASCSSCSQRLATLQRVVAAARLDEPGEEVPAPRGAWHAIAAELGMVPAGADGPARSSSVHRDDRAVHVAPRRRGAVTGAAGPPARARRRGLWALAAAAAAGLLLGWTVGQGTAGDAPPSTALASARLEPLPLDTGRLTTGQATGGHAELDRLSDTRRLDVSTDGLGGPGEPASPAGEDGYLEVWLIDVADGRLVSLGVLDGGSGSFTVPAAVDTSAYSTVDVSWEPVDGEPAHSGESVLRGTLSPEA